MVHQEGMERQTKMQIDDKNRNNFLSKARMSRIRPPAGAKQVSPKEETGNLLNFVAAQSSEALPTFYSEDAIAVVDKERLV